MRCQHNMCTHQELTAAVFIASSMPFMFNKYALTAVAAKEHATLHTQRLGAMRHTQHSLICVDVSCQREIRWEGCCRERHHENPFDRWQTSCAMLWQQRDVR